MLRSVSFSSSVLERLAYLASCGFLRHLHPAGETFFKLQKATSSFVNRNNNLLGRVDFFVARRGVHVSLVMLRYEFFAMNESDKKKHELEAGRMKRLLARVASTTHSSLAIKIQVSRVSLNYFTATHQYIKLGGFQHQNFNFPLVPSTWESPVGWRSIIIRPPVAAPTTAFVVVCPARTTATSAFVVVRHLEILLLGDFPICSPLRSAELRVGASIANSVFLRIGRVCSGGLADWRAGGRSSCSSRKCTKTGSQNHAQARTVLTANTVLYSTIAWAPVEGAASFRSQCATAP